MDMMKRGRRNNTKMKYFDRFLTLSPLDLAHKFNETFFCSINDQQNSPRWSMPRWDLEKHNKEASATRDIKFVSCLATYTLQLAKLSDIIRSLGASALIVQEYLFWRKIPLDMFPHQNESPRNYTSPEQWHLHKNLLKTAAEVNYP